MAQSPADAVSERLRVDPLLLGYGCHADVFDTLAR